MRKAFVRKLIEFAEKDASVMLLSGDMGFNFFEPFINRFPDRFLNVGICEQAMAGIAAGLAKEGRRVYMYSIASFPTLRCFEQLRNDVCYHKLNVTVVSNGGGLAYGYLGMSHHATEDISAMRALPGMSVTVPADPLEVEAAMDYLARHGGPGYLRMCRGGEPVLHDAVPMLSESVLLPLDVISPCDPTVRILAAGEVASEAVGAAQILRAQGIPCEVWSVPVVKPAPRIAWQNSTRLLVTLEENNIIGGVGGMVAEALSEHERHPRLLRLGMPDCFSSVVGKNSYLRSVYGLDASHVAEAVRCALEDQA